MPIEAQRLVGHSGPRKADGERGLCQTIDRKQGGALESRGREAAEKFFAQFDADRFGAVEDQPDARQIEIIQRACAQHLEAMPVAEVGRAQHARAHLGGELQPQQRAADEQVRGHQMRRQAVGEHHQMKADQAHVMRQRHPRQADVILTNIDRGADAGDVGHQIGVREHHALGMAGRAGGELDEGHIFRTRPIALAGALDRFELIHQKGASAQRFV